MKAGPNMNIMHAKGAEERLLLEGYRMLGKKSRDAVLSVLNAYMNSERLQAERWGGGAAAPEGKETNILLMGGGGRRRGHA